MREVAEVQKELDAQRAQNKMPMSLAELGSDRDALRADYEAYQALPKEGQQEPEPEKEPEPEVEAKPEKAETEKKDFVPETPKPDEEKTVPYGALKEEREKRKELARKIKELEESFKQAAEDNKKLVELMSSKSDDEPITDYEKEILSLRKQLKVAMSKIDSFEKGQVQQRQVTEQDRLTALVNQTHTELAKDGFDGFDDFVPQVIKAMDDEDIPMEERTPATWKKVFKEVVYPKYIGKYKVDTKAEKKAEKEAEKKEASLIKSPGKPDAKKKDEEDTTPQAYARWREKLDLFNAPF